MDTPVRTFPNDSAVRSMAATNNIELVSSVPHGANQESAHIWSLGGGQIVQTFVLPQGRTALGVALSPDGQRAVVSSDGVKAVLWDANSGQLIGSTPVSPGSDSNSHIAFSPDGQLIVSVFSADITVFDTTLRQKSLFRAVRPGASVSAIALSPEGRFVAAGYTRADTTVDDDVIVYDLLSGQTTLHFKANPGSGVTSIAWTGNNILTGSPNKTIKLWNAQSGAPVSRPFPTHSGTVNALAVSADGRLALSGSGDGTMKVIEVSTGKELRSIAHADGGVTAVAFAGTSQSAVSCGGNSTKLWDLTGL